MPWRQLETLQTCGNSVKNTVFEANSFAANLQRDKLLLSVHDLLAPFTWELVSVMHSLVMMADLCICLVYESLQPRDMNTAHQSLTHCGK